MIDNMEGRRKQPSRGSLIQAGEIPSYVQRGFSFDAALSFFSANEPARFNNAKPHGLRLSDDAWAALKLRVDPLARNLLDPHRSYVGAAGVGLLITAVFLAIRPGWNRQQVMHRESVDDDDAGGDDAMFDDYFDDDEWDRNNMDDVIMAELEYLNAALDKSMWVWRIGLVTSLVVLFGSVIFLAILMERRNAAVDESIGDVIEEIRPRIEDEGLSVDYRTRASQQGIVLFVGMYIRPSRVIVFRYLDHPLVAEGLVAGGLGERRAKKTSSFFSYDYQRRYFPPASPSVSPRSVPGTAVGNRQTVASSAQSSSVS